MLQRAHGILAKYLVKKPKSSQTKRPYSKITHIPHAFPIEEAQKKMLATTSSQMFTTIITSQNANQKFSRSLKATLVPVTSIQATTTSWFEAEISKNRNVTTIKTDSVGTPFTHTAVVTDWEYISGHLKAHHYQEHEPNMSIYCGETYYSTSVENALEEQKMSEGAQPFNLHQVSKDIEIDPWKKVESHSQAIAKKRIAAAEEQRVIDYIYKIYGSVNSIHMKNIKTEYIITNDAPTGLSLKTYMLPLYVLSQDNAPDQFLSGISPSAYQVTGAPSSISTLAVGMTINLLLSGLTLLPSISGQNKVIALFALAMLNGIAMYHWENGKPPALQERASIGAEKLENMKLERTADDDERLRLTSILEDKGISQEEPPRPSRP